jgi:hypothetical protein
MKNFKKIRLEYSGVKTLLPDIDYFLNKIENNEVIRFLRVNHGFIDGIHWAYPNLLEFDSDFENKRYDIIAKKIVDIYSNKQSGLAYWHSIDNFLVQTISDLMKLIREYDEISDKIDIAISLGVGLNEFWGVHNQHHPVQKGRTEFSHSLDKYIQTPFFYSGVLKHYTIKGEIHHLFKSLNNKNYNVVFLGPGYFGKHKNVFNIKNWNFIEIPRRDAMSDVGNYISQIYSINNSAYNPTIVFLQCGHIMAAHIIETMMDDNISFIDVGRSFDILIKEEFVNGDLALKCWTGLDMNHLNQYVDNLRK